MTGKAPSITLDCPACWPQETYWTRATGVCKCDLCGSELIARESVSASQPDVQIVIQDGEAMINGTGRSDRKHLQHLRPNVNAATPLYLSALDASRPDFSRGGERSTTPAQN